MSSPCSGWFFFFFFFLITRRHCVFKKKKNPTKRRLHKLGFKAGYRHQRATHFSSGLMTSYWVWTCPPLIQWKCVIVITASADQKMSRLFSAAVVDRHVVDTRRLSSCVCVSSLVLLFLVFHASPCLTQRHTHTHTLSSV